MANQKIDVIVVEVDSARQKTHTQIIPLYGISRRLDGIEGLTVLAFCYRCQILRVVCLGKSCFGFPPHRSLSAPILNQAPKKTFRLIEIPPIRGDAARKTQGLEENQMVRALFRKPYCLPVVPFCFV